MSRVCKILLELHLGLEHCHCRYYGTLELLAFLTEHCGVRLNCHSIPLEHYAVEQDFCLGHKRMVLSSFLTLQVEDQASRLTR
jgi:hypothetical protein